MPDSRPDELLGALSRANPVPPGSVDEASSEAAEAMFARIVATEVRRPVWLRAVRHRQPLAHPDDRELDRLLVLANPLPEAEAGAAPLDRRSSALLTSLLEGTDRPAAVSPPVARRRRVVITAVAGTCLVAAAGGYVLASRPVTNATVVRCFAKASLASTSVVLNPTAAGATATCRSSVWKKGGFGTPKSPALVACVLADGIEAVFPGSSDATCSHLGLSAALAPSALARRTADLDTALLAATSPTNCLTTSAADATVNRLLRSEGLASWKVIGTATSPTRPCVTAVVDVPDHTVQLLAQPRPRSPAPTGPGATGPRSTS